MTPSSPSTLSPACPPPVLALPQEIPSSTHFLLVPATTTRTVEEPLSRPHFHWLPSNPFLILHMYTVSLLKTLQWLCSAFRIKIKCPSQRSCITGALWPPCWISGYLLTQSSNHSGLPLLDCAHARHPVWNVLPCSTSSSCCLPLSRLQPRPSISREACPGPQVGLNVFVTRFHQPGASFLKVLLGLSWNIPLCDPVVGP